jgi:MIP family channel proteins
MIGVHFPKLLAEAIGTAVLVLSGCGAIVINTVSNGSVTHLGIALTFGLSIGVMIMAVGHISGAHFNPAVTLALASQRLFPLNLVLPYLGAQCLGALFGAAILRDLFGVTSNLGATLPAGEPFQSFILEIILTAILVFVIAAVALHPKSTPAHAPFAIGGTVALEALFAGPISGASMNPARSLAPALIAGQLDYLWIYLLAPIIGGLIGILIYQAINQPNSEVITS